MRPKLKCPQKFSSNFWGHFIYVHALFMDYDNLIRIIPSCQEHRYRSHTNARGADGIVA